MGPPLEMSVYLRGCLDRKVERLSGSVPLGVEMPLDWPHPEMCETDHGDGRCQYPEELKPASGCVLLPALEG